MADRESTVPELIAMRRRRRVLRMARMLGAATSSCAAGLAVVALASADDVVTPVARTTAATTSTSAVVTERQAAITTTTITAATTTTTVTEPASVPPVEPAATTTTATPTEAPVTTTQDPAPEAAPIDSSAVPVDAAPAAGAPVAEPVSAPPLATVTKATPSAQKRRPVTRHRPKHVKARAPHKRPDGARKKRAATRKRRIAAPAARGSGSVPSPVAAAVHWAALTDLRPPSLAGGDASAYGGPLVLLPVFQAAATQHDVPWEVLASINDIETGYGRNVAVSSAGAVGWMQFMPSTWARYGTDADGDGVADPQDPVDAIFAAADYLSAAGARDDIRKSVFAYNHADWYVDKVMAGARRLASIPDDVLAPMTERGLHDVSSLQGDAHRDGFLEDGMEVKDVGQAMLLSDANLRRWVAEHAEIYACGREELLSGAIDRRVLVAIARLSTDGMRPSISSLRCGHGQMTASGNLSEHTTGTAVDVAAINGVSIVGHQGPGSLTERVLDRLVKLRGAYAPHQIISLMTVAGAPNTIAMSDHADHVHVGFRPMERQGS